MLRLISIVLREPRAPLDLDGFRFERAVSRRVYFGGANRDPAVFADPTASGATRDPKPAPRIQRRPPLLPRRALARLHGQVAIGLALERLPGLRLAGGPEWRSTLPLRTLTPTCHVERPT